MSETKTVDLSKILRIVTRNIWIIALCAILVAGLSLGYVVAFVTPTYQAEISMYINNSSNKNGVVNASDLSVALKLVTTYVNIVTSDSVLDQVIDELDLGMSASAVRKMLTAEAVDETEMFRVRVSHEDPEMAAKIANTIGQIAPKKITEIIDGSSAKIIDMAKVPTGRAAPNYVKTMIIGLFVGAALSAALVILQDFLDVRIKSEEDLMEISDAPILGVIPDLNPDAKHRGMGYVYVQTEAQE